MRPVSAVFRASQPVETRFGRPGDAHRREGGAAPGPQDGLADSCPRGGRGPAGPEAGSWAPRPPGSFPVHSQRCEPAGCPAWPGLLTESAAPEGETKGSVPRAPIRRHPRPPFRPAEVLPTEPRAGTLCLLDVRSALEPTPLVSSWLRTALRWTPQSQGVR